MARALFERIAEQLNQPVSSGDVSSEEQCEKLLAFTAFDRARLRDEMQRRLQNPPFTTQLNHSEQMMRLAMEEQETESPEGTAAAYQWAIGQKPEDRMVEMQKGRSRSLPFAIRCDGAGQENYKDGSPRKWWSKLAVVQEGQEVERKEIVVNDPLVYKGVRFYQSSYGPNGKVDQLIVTAAAREARAGGEAKQLALSPNEPVRIDADTTVKLAEFIPDYVVRDGQVYTRSAEIGNPAAHLVVTSEKSGQSVQYWMPPIEGFAENEKSPFRFEAQDLKMGYFTGLQVSHEPGQWCVWSGVLLMGVGLTLVFYMSHVRFWVVPVRNEKGQLSLWMGGTANRNRDAFESHFEELTVRVAAELKDEKSSSATQEVTLAHK